MIIVAYWTGTGNTEKMAEAVAAGITAAGGEAKVVAMEQTTAAEIASCDAFALGCPAMGAEELEDAVVEPLVTELEGQVSGKKIGLFGSYDWGDGEWMRLWVERMQNAGATVVNGEGVICNLEPDADAIAACEALGKALV